MIDFGLYFTYFLLVIAVLGAIAFPIMHAIQSPAAFMKSLYGVVAMIILFGISYAISSSEVMPKWAALGVSETTSKLVGAGLILFYITLVISIIGLVYSEINKALK